MQLAAILAPEICLSKSIGNQRDALSALISLVTAATRSPSHDATNKIVVKVTGHLSQAARLLTKSINFA